jgi:hypothetical protein
MRHVDARTIADIEAIIEQPDAADEWTVDDVSCVRNRHRFRGDEYSFAFDVIHLRYVAKGHRSWHATIVSELWEFKRMRGRPRGAKQLNLGKGTVADVKAWIRHHHEKKAALRKPKNLEQRTSTPKSSSKRPASSTRARVAEKA